MSRREKDASRLRGRPRSSFKNSTTLRILERLLKRFPGSSAGAVQQGSAAGRKAPRAFTISPANNSARIDRSLARGTHKEPKPCVTIPRRASYTRHARDTRTLATIAGSALARGGARTFSSWRYRAASRRPPASRVSLSLFLFTPNRSA